MEKFSVKKPFTVLVAVIMVLMLGFVSITKMKTNLLPDVSTPYLMVVTVYPGASPERVESEVSDVLQNALTVPGVEKITATSAENYSLLLMKFVDDTDMNSALVQVSNKLDQAKSDLPDIALTPSVIQYSMNMNAFMTVAVSREGSSVYELSDFIKNTMTPYVQRKGGVSSVSSSGLVEQLVQVQLNQEKVDAINEKLMELIDTQLEAAHAQLEEAEAKIAAGRAEYDKQFKNFGNTVSNTVMGTLSSEVGSAVEVVRKQAEALLQSVNNLIAVVKEPEVQQALIEVQAGLQRVLDKFNNTGMRDIDSLIEIVSELRDITDKLSSALQTLQNRINTETGTQGEGAADLADELQLQDSLNVIYKTLEDTIKAMDNVPGMMGEFSKALGSFTQQQLAAYMQFTEAREMLNEYEKQLSEAKTQYEAAKEKALASADVAKQLDIKTLSTLIYAQNFSMPAGYVKDESGESWLLKVGEEYDSVEDIRGALLLHVEGYGDVRLSDVADVEVIDNAAVGNLCPDDKALFIAQVVEILCVLVVRQPDGISTHFQNDGDILFHHFVRQRDACALAVLMPGNTAQRIAAAVQDKALLGVNLKLPASKPGRRFFAIVQLGRNSIQERVVDAVPEVCIVQRENSLCGAVFHRGGDALAFQRKGHALCAHHGGFHSDLGGLSGKVGDDGGHLQRRCAVGRQGKVLCGNNVQGHIPVNAAVEGEVCLLGVHGVVVAVVHADCQQIFLFEMFGQVHPEGRVAALVLGQLFAVQVDYSGHSGTVQLQNCFAVSRDGGLCQRQRIPAGAAVVIVAAVLTVYGVPCMGQGNGLAHHGGGDASVFFGKMPVVI